MSNLMHKRSVFGWGCRHVGRGADEIFLLVRPRGAMIAETIVTHEDFVAVVKDGSHSALTVT